MILTHGFGRPIQFQFIHRMRLILNIICIRIIYRCIIYKWLRNADPIQNSRSAIPVEGNKKYENRYAEGTVSLFFPKRSSEVRQSHWRFSFCSRNTEHGKKCLCARDQDRARHGYPVIAAKRTNIPPGSPSSGLSSFVANWRSLRSIPRSHFREIRERAKRNRSPCESTVRSKERRGSAYPERIKDPPWCCGDHYKETVPSNVVINRHIVYFGVYIGSHCTVQFEF